MNINKKSKIIVGLSGGVDSAVAAWTLKQQGHEVIGIFMKNWEGDDNDEYCSSRQDFIDAAAVADVLGIEIEHINFSKEYQERVFSHFLKEYSAGRTPNPDILCNSEIKFKAFLDHAINLGADKIATGHYARTIYNESEKQYHLLKGLDNTKDQSYFLHRLTQTQLSKSIFPIGHLEKKQVRQIAEELNLPNAKKKDSTGICFIGERPFREFLNKYLHSKKGNIKTEKGQTIGTHMGLSFYTLGQRQGLGIGGVKDAPDAPWYIAKKNIETNTLIAVQNKNHPLLLSNKITISDISLTGNHQIINNTNLCVKTRYRQADSKCTISELANKAAIINFDKDNMQWAATAGQSAVIYDGEKCLGGGIIDLAENI